MEADSPHVAIMEPDAPCSSDEFEQELPGESSALPLQQQDFDLAEQHSRQLDLGASFSTTTHAGTETLALQPQASAQKVVDGTAYRRQQAEGLAEEAKPSPVAKQQHSPVLQPIAGGDSPQLQHRPTSNSPQQQNPDQSEHSPVRALHSPHTFSIWGRTSLSSSIAAHAATPPLPIGKPSYVELSLRCQALENALEQQQHHSEGLQQALAALQAAHAAEEASIRQYYEAQLADRQQEIQLLVDRLAAHQAAVAAAGPTGPGSSILLNADGSVAAGGADAGSRAMSPWPQQRQDGQRPSSRQQQQRDGSAAAASDASSALLADVALLRRELSQAEQLLAGYEHENKAAATRIKDLESQLSTARAAVADEAGRAHRAAAAAAEAHRVNGAAAAERLSRQLQLEGQLEALTAQATEREAELLDQIEQLRSDKAGAEARAAAAAEGVDMARWQAEDARIAELQQQLSAQATSHQQQISELQSRLSWYVENQTLLGQSDTLVSQQADVIHQLEQQLREAEALADGKAAARIRELEQQVQHLKQLLAARHPSSLPAAALAAATAADGAACESAALSAAQDTIKQLQHQLDLQQQQHEHSLRSLQQQYEALKHRLEQQRHDNAETTGPRSRVHELTHQLEDQRSMYTRKIKALEAKLTAAQGAAAAAAVASRRSSMTGSMLPGNSKHLASDAPNRSIGRVGLRSASKRAATGCNMDVSGVNGDQRKLAASGEVAERTEQAAQHCTSVAAQQPASVATTGAADDSGQSASLEAGLLQIKERQMASLAAQLEERTGQFLQLQQKLRAAERQIKQLTCVSCNNTSAGAAGPSKSSMDTHHHAEVTQSNATDVASWPALCAELETEVDQLKAQLAISQQALVKQSQQMQELQARLGAWQTTPLAEVQGSTLAPIPMLLSIAEEAAQREASKWRDRVRCLEERLQDAQTGIRSMQQELDQCRAQGGWTPSIAAFEALERKINTLEAAQKHSLFQSPQTQHVPSAIEVACVTRYEQMLAAKEAELQSFRFQVDALLSTAKQLQGLH